MFIQSIARISPVKCTDHLLPLVERNTLGQGLLVPLNFSEFLQIR